MREACLGFLLNKRNRVHQITEHRPSVAAALHDGRLERAHRIESLKRDVEESVGSSERQRNSSTVRNPNIKD